MACWKMGRSPVRAALKNRVARSRASGGSVGLDSVEGVGASDSVGCDGRAAAEGSMRSGIAVDECMCEWRKYFGVEGIIVL